MHRIVSIPKIISFSFCLPLFLTFWKQTYTTTFLGINSNQNVKDERNKMGKLRRGEGEALASVLMPPLSHGKRKKQEKLNKPTIRPIEPVLLLLLTRGWWHLSGWVEPMWYDGENFYTICKKFPRDSRKIQCVWVNLAIVALIADAGDFWPTYQSSYLTYTGTRNTIGNTHTDMKCSWALISSLSRSFIGTLVDHHHAPIGFWVLAA